MYTYSLFRLVIAIANVWMTSAILSRCINRKVDKVAFTCPEGQVIYNPDVQFGRGHGKSCVPGPDDCQGRSARLEHVVNSCVWKNTCKVQWRSRDQITSSKNNTCIGLVPTYIMYDNPTCVPQDEIIDMCAHDGRLQTLSKGVIRSSPGYPYRYTDVITSCQKGLRSRSGYVLVIILDDLKTSGQDHLRITSTITGQEKNLIYSKEAQGESFLLAKGDVKIYFLTSSEKASGRGFSLRFQYVRDTISNEVEWKSLAPKVKPEQASRTINTVKGTVDRCLKRKNDVINIVCPLDHVIFKPNILAGVHNGRSCVSQEGDCRGSTVSLVKDRNLCYWKRQCRVLLARGHPLVASNTINCMAKTANYFSVVNYQCLPKDRVFDMCDDASIVLNGTFGTIVSHANYPWHYETREISCRKYIQVSRRYGLHIYTEDMDLDPNSKGDNLQLRETIEGKDLKSLIGGQRGDISLTRGCLMIEFNVSRRSLGAPGFILRFETIRKPRTEETDSQYDDCSKSVMKLSFRRRNSQNEGISKHRKAKVKKAYRSDMVPKVSCKGTYSTNECRSKHLKLKIKRKLRARRRREKGIGTSRKRPRKTKQKSVARRKRNRKKRKRKGKKNRRTKKDRRKRKRGKGRKGRHYKKKITDSMRGSWTI